MSSEQIAVSFGRRLHGCRMRTYIARRRSPSRAAPPDGDRPPRARPSRSAHRHSASPCRRAGRQAGGAPCRRPPPTTRRAAHGHRGPRPRERDETVEASLLAIACDLHPEHLSADDLIRRAMAAMLNPPRAQVLERALERLKDAQLLRTRPTHIPYACGSALSPTAHLIEMETLRR